MVPCLIGTGAIVMIWAGLRVWRMKPKRVIEVLDFESARELFPALDEEVLREWCSRGKILKVNGEAVIDDVSGLGMWILNNVRK